MSEQTARLDTHSVVPLYLQLMQRLRSDIISGVYPAHSRLPSEQELCDTWQVSRVTVRKALAALQQSGMLERHQGKGTFVAAPRIRKDLRSINSFNDACQAMGREPSTQLIRACMALADEQDVTYLSLEPGDEVVELVRLRLSDGEPVMLETNHFPQKFAWLIHSDLTGSLYSLLREQGAAPEQAEHEISLTQAGPTEARLLGVDTGDALLSLNEVIYDQNGQPLHTSRQMIRGDRFAFRI